MAVPSATTAVVAAARAAAEVVCLTGGAQSHFMKEDIAAVINKQLSEVTW